MRTSIVGRNLSLESRLLFTHRWSWFRSKQSYPFECTTTTFVGNEEIKRPGLEVVKDPESEKDPNVKQTYAEVVKKVSWKEETTTTETTAAAETQLLSLSI